MFKVHENGDGTTSIFCSKTGKLICSIGKQQSMGLGCRPVNVIEQSPRNTSCCYSIETQEVQDLETGSDEEKANIKNEECDFPILDEEPDEDFSAEVITSEDFARCLNLVSTEKFNNQPINDLKPTFPLRLISRTKVLPSDTKYPEDLPISSSLGQKVLKANKHKNIYCDQTIELKIKCYENFCRFQINSSYVFNHPNLRCRDKKEYPVSFPSKNSKVATAHTYAFNKRQRLENLITIKTGLNTESRKLLRSCNKRLAVSIKRLPDDEIKHWLQKRARLGPITADLIRGEDSLFGSDSDATVVEQNSSTYVDIDLCSDDSSDSSDNDDPPYKCKMPKVINFQGVLSTNSSLLRNRNGQSPKRLMKYFTMYKDSSVVLNNVLHSLQRCHGDYYVAGTNIRVPFLRDYLNLLDPKKRKNFAFPETKLVVSPRYDHAYHRPFSAIADKKRNLFSSSNCLNHKNSKRKIDYKNPLKESSSFKNKSLKSDNVKRSNSLKPNLDKPANKAVIIPFIDLTVSPPNSPPKKSKVNFYCTFHCYGCGYNVKSPKEIDTRLLAAQHLKGFHCVSDPQSFLNINNTSSGVVFEAFPGYKKDSSN